MTMVEANHILADPAEVLARTALALGVRSPRADLLALRAARAHAAQRGRSGVQEEDLLFAVRLVLAPRATQRPPEPAPPEQNLSEGQERCSEEALDDIVLDAARAALPPDLLERLQNGRGRGPAPRARGAAERRRSPLRGRPVGARPGLPRGGRRLALIDTLRAAAPWQRLRRAEETGEAADRLRLRRADLRIRRFEQRAESLTIVAVDASGSSARARLGEAKGAVELLLGQAYSKRAEVALIAFRGAGAELLLPPTRSLTRARRLLEELPGGGATPLAAGIEAARALAAQARGRGRTPFLVLLTDGRANLAADGTPGRARAEADAEAAARRLAAEGVGGTVIDIGVRAQPESARLAGAMGAVWLHLPRADAAALHAALA